MPAVTQALLVAVAVSSSTYQHKLGRTWLDYVHGCSCCLSRTDGVSSCYLAAKGCSSLDTLRTCCKEQDGQQALPKVTSVCHSTDIVRQAAWWTAYNSAICCNCLPVGPHSICYGHPGDTAMDCCCSEQGVGAGYASVSSMPATPHTTQRTATSPQSTMRLLGMAVKKWTWLKGCHRRLP